MKGSIYFSQQDLQQIVRDYVVSKFKMGKYDTMPIFNVIVEGEEYADVVISAEIHV